MGRLFAVQAPLIDYSRELRRDSNTLIFYSKILRTSANEVRQESRGLRARHPLRGKEPDRAA